MDAYQSDQFQLLILTPSQLIHPIHLWVIKKYWNSIYKLYSKAILLVDRICQKVWYPPAHLHRKSGKRNITPILFMVKVTQSSIKCKTAYVCLCVCVWKKNYTYIYVYIYICIYIIWKNCIGRLLSLVVSCLITSDEGVIMICMECGRVNHYL